MTETITVYSTPAPVLTVDQAIQNHNQIVEYVQRFLKEDVDYGKVKTRGGGTAFDKPILLKPGAEKLCKLFGLTPEFQLLEAVTNWEQGLFAYHYQCRLNRGGTTVATGDGACNTKEKKYSNGRQSPYDLQNTVIKMAQKRAFTQAVLIATSGSEFFTQDMEVIDADVEEIAPPAQQVEPPTRKASPQQNQWMKEIQSEAELLHWTRESLKQVAASFGVHGSADLNDSNRRLIINRLKEPLPF